MMTLQASTDQAEFAITLFMLISKIAGRNDYATLHHLGIRSDQLAKIQALNTQEIQQLALVAKTSIVSVQVNSEALDAAINLSHQRVAEHNLVLNLLKGGASKAILKQLFGLTSTEVTELRRFLALPRMDGRPTIPAEHEQAELWTAWQALRQQSMRLPEQLLGLHQTTGLDIKAIWSLLQIWMGAEKVM